VRVGTVGAATTISRHTAEGKPPTIGYMNDSGCLLLRVHFPPTVDKIVDKCYFSATAVPVKSAWIHGLRSVYRATCSRTARSPCCTRLLLQPLVVHLWFLCRKSGNDTSRRRKGQVEGSARESMAIIISSCKPSDSALAD